VTPVEQVDVAVIGCGGAGAAAAWRLASRGRRVAAIERFEPAHRRGSSQGLLAERSRKRRRTPRQQVTRIVLDVIVVRR
jgi:glycine/D-amino acid oxidase-like deaminating enzyme